ncbi:MAG: putative Ig domain-containing protein [Nocardioides sp.]|jgi:hypothetical protein
MSLRRLVLALLSLLLPVALIAPVSGEPAAAAIRTKLVAKLITSSVAPGGEARIQGTLKAGRKPLARRKVIVQRRLDGTTKFRKVGVVKTNRKGKWKFKQTNQQRTATFRAKFKGGGGYKPSRSKQVTLTVQGTGTAPTITTSTLLNGMVGAAYSATLKAEGTAPLTWLLTSGSLPRGLTLSSAGVISGTPTQTFSNTFGVSVSNSAGSASATLKLTILQGTSPTSTASPTTSATATPTTTPTVEPGDLVITTTALPPATKGQPYDFTLTATGGVAPLQWSAEEMPAGLSLSSAGRITGTPTKVTIYPLRIIVSSSDGDLAGKLFGLSVAGTGPLTIITAERLPDLAVDATPYITIESNEPDSKLTWTSSDTLPPGLRLDTISENAVMRGYATTAGDFTFTVTATDGVRTASRTFKLRVLPAGDMLTIDTNLPLAKTNQPYGFRFTTNATTPVTFGSVGALPPGMSLGVDGILRGTPTTTGNTTFAVTATTADRLAQQEVTFVVADGGSGSIAITGTPPDGLRGAPYSAQLGAVGGGGTLNWSGEALPPGLTLSSTGRIFGRPSTTGTYESRVFVNDGQNAYANATFTIKITESPTPLAVDSTLPGAQVGVEYAYVLKVAGGTAPHTWSITSGAPPAGLTLNAQGLLSGTPTATGTATFTVKVTDASAATGTATVTLTVTAPSTTTQWVTDGTQRNWAPYEKTITGDNVELLGIEYDREASGDRLDVRGNNLAECVSLDGLPSVRVAKLNSGAQVWRRNDAECTEIKMTPSLVVISNYNGIQARALSDGSLVWDTATTNSGQAAGRLLITGTSVLTQYGDALVSYRLSDGAFQWKRTLTGSIGDWAADAARVYLKEEDNLVARSLAGNGAVAWSRPLAGLGNIVALPNRDEVVVTAGAGLSWRSVSTGAEVRSWTNNDEGANALSADDQRAYVATYTDCSWGVCSGAIFAIRHADATKAWSHDLGERIWGKPAVTDGIVWGSVSGLIRNGGTSQFYGWDTATGAELAHVELPHPGANRTLAGAGHLVAPTYYKTFVLGTGPSQLVVPRQNLPGTFTGQPYAASLSASGGKAPLTWVRTAGTLPPGVTLAADGTLGGTATTAGVYDFTAKVTDALGLSKTVSTTVTVRSVAPAQWLRPYGTDAQNPSTLTMRLGDGELATFSQRWSATTPYSYSSKGFAIGDGRAYVITDNFSRLEAYPTAGSTATAAWSTPGPDGQYWIGGTVLSGTGVGARLYAQLTDGTVAALDPTNGTILWRTRPAVGDNRLSENTAPLLAGGRLITRTRAALTGYDLSTHAPAWSIPMTDDRGASSDGTRVFTYEGCELQARRAADGVKVWSQSLGQCYLGEDPPVVFGDAVYLHDGYLYRAFNATTGTPLWSRRGYLTASAKFAVNEQYLVAPGFGNYGGFDVLDRRTGELANFVENVTAGTLTLVGDTALTTSANTIVATDIVSGTKLWESPALGYSMQHVQVSGGRLYYREQGDGTTGRLLAFGPP